MLGNCTKRYSGNEDFKENLMILLQQVCIEDVSEFMRMILPHQGVQDRFCICHTLRLF